MRWDPWRELTTIQDRLNQLIEEFGARTFGRSGDGDSTWSPVIDVSERDDAFLVRVELPGVAADKIGVTLQENAVTVKGTRDYDETAQAEQFHQVERPAGPFERTIRLPAGVSTTGCRARHHNGVTEILLPKAPEQRPHQINVVTEPPAATIEAVPEPAPDSDAPTTPADS